MPEDVFGDASRAGAWAAVRLAVDGETIVGADAPGLERPLAGLTLLEAAAARGAPLAVEALAAAIGHVFQAAPQPGRVAVAMSGGVDSAVALLRAGEEAIGVTLRLWQDPAAPDTERACCSAEAVAAARATCHALGRPHVTIDRRREFKHTIVDPFTRAYEHGETPNPCMRCNGTFRFDELVAFAERAGADELWTGHYARVVERGGARLVGRGFDERKDQSYMLAAVDPALLERVRFPLGGQTKEATRAEAAAAGLAAARRTESQEACFLGGDDYRAFLERQGLGRGGGVRLVGKARDARKDQSYMLAAVDPQLLDRVRFPLGDQTKEETREEAAALGLAAARRAESQEACFLGGDDYRAFLERQGLAATRGPVVDLDGRAIGEHDGYWRFTPGQRRGVGVAASRPLYVLRTDAASNTVTVGSREHLASRVVEARGRLYGRVARADAKLRYRSAPVRADVGVTEEGFTLALDEPAYGVARGQVAVLYDEDAVVGAGVVTAVDTEPLGSPR